MKERADGEQWRSENHSLIETSFPVSEKAGSKHKYINWKADMGNVRLIFLLGPSPHLHICAEERNSWEHREKKEWETIHF